MKIIPPFEQWPAAAQLAFEKYYALDGGSRTLEAASALSGSSYHQIKRWARKFAFQAEIERRDRALAAEQRARTLARRRGVLDAAEAGVGALIARYSAAAQGRCPVCMGSGIIKVKVVQMRGGAGLRTVPEEQVCGRCSGSGHYDAMDLNMLAYDRAISRYGVMAGDLSDPDDTPRGPISHEEWAAHQRDMLAKAGAKVAAQQLAALPAPEDEDT